MKTPILAVLLSIVLTGCLMPMPGDTSTTVSKFDNTKQVSVEPGLIYNGMLSSSIKLGAHWNSKMGDEAVLHVIYQFVDSINGISFNIDGEIVSLTPIDALTSFEPGYYSGYYSSGATSAQRFNVKLEFLQRLVSAKKVMVKVDLSKTFAEGELRDGFTMAKPGFVKFLAQVKQAKSTP